MKFDVNGGKKLEAIFFARRLLGSIILQNGVQIANTERAVADILYFKPKFHFDNEAQIDWKKVRALQTCIGYI